ncbi:hypothetical protein COU49_00340 [Candidatus Nomurabacteria bacterium CG10_big_fil_rev_8_21_14_0_10_35_16]|uniref:Uncharacterized protein n=1 Tax=Candidatus Nomurabacteria bacterium CG10_big_fil_rev_8_21_14_0_10_35_16 TaxID=1974731 RepID=A0A2H0TC66_9BACT|nr:MAG: hypothetical protein COU49_00340 [Candidatus Nomurabacteria bacterium CG10_big_fil_rev_8_21_14_0_10_35_16]
MNHKESQFLKIKKPEIRPIESYKKRLRTALLLAHGNRSKVQMFYHIIINSIQNMSIIQKRTVFGVAVLAGLVITAGIFGPSAASVAHAEAQELVGRAFARISNLSETERAELEQKFGERVQFQGNGQGPFMGMNDLAPEEIEKMHATIKASLVDALAEAQAAPDLKIISADEMPTPGFVGKAGRAVGLKMRQNQTPEEKLANLPADVRERIEEHSAFREEMQPVSFLVYTNSNGQVVYLGVNAENEPVAKFIKSENGSVPIAPGQMMKYKVQNRNAQ